MDSLSPALSLIPVEVEGRGMVDILMVVVMVGVSGLMFAFVSWFDQI